MVLSIVIPLLETDYEFYRCYYSIISVLDLDKCEIVVVTPKANVASLSQFTNSLKVYEEKGKGIYDAMNQGLESASGKFIMFLGKDDLILPSLRDLCSLLEKQDKSIYVSDVIYSTGTVYRNFINKYFLLFRNWCHQGVVYNKRLFDNLEFNPVYKVQADHYLNIRIVTSTSSNEICKFLYPVSVYSNSGFSTYTKDNKFWLDYPQIVRQCYGSFFSTLIKIKRLFGV